MQLAGITLTVLLYILQNVQSTWFLRISCCFLFLLYNFSSEYTLNADNYVQATYTILSRLRLFKEVLLTS